MGKRKTRKRSRRGGKGQYMFGSYLGDETCVWYETVDGCSEGKCSGDKVIKKEKEKCGELINFTQGEVVKKFDPFTASASWTGSLVFKQEPTHKTPKLPIEFQGKKLINAGEMKDGFVGKKNVYYIIHEVKSKSTKGPRWALRVFKNCDVKKKGESVTIKCPEHNDPIEATLYPDKKMILKWGSKETPEVKYGTLLFGDSTAGGRKRTKKRRRSTKKRRKSRRRRKRTKKRRRRRR